MTRLIDLTHLFDASTPVAPILPPVNIEPVLNVEEHCTNVLMCSFPTHAGTHLDAPRHFSAEGATIDSIGLDVLVGPASFIGLDLELHQEITGEMLAESGAHVKRGDRLFIKSGFCTRYREPDYFEHPYFTADGVKWVLDAGVSLLAMDMLSPEIPHSLRQKAFAFPSHCALLGQGVLIAENINYPEDLPLRFSAMVLPLPIRDGDGAPARILAEVG